MSTCEYACMRERERERVLTCIIIYKSQLPRNNDILKLHKNI